MRVHWKFVFALVWTALVANSADAKVNVVVVRSDAGESKPSSTRQVAPPPASHVTSFTIPGEQRFTIDTTESPKLTQWAEQELSPVVQQWYPRIVELLSSDGFSAPNSFAITFSPGMRGVAATGGTNIRCGERWFLGNLDGEAKGAVVHELVHVVQQYKWTRRSDPNGPQTPGWLVEGIADYIRWFIYEPQSNGAVISPQRLAAVRFDDSYRVGANFLNWVSEHYDEKLVARLNAALREGRYRDSMWTEVTGKPVEELGKEWKASFGGSLVAAVAEPSPAEPALKPSSGEHSINTLSDKEKSEGWQLLFNGKDFKGWHNFGAEGVRPGWKIKEGTLACVDPHDAGDLCTADQFEWFELKLEYNISKGGNSGIMFRVAEKGNAPWESGPELQLEDNAFARDPVRCGWLYALYQPPNDPGTAKPLDATKPAGEWNEVRLLVSPDKCVHTLNGTKYFEYELGSEDFQRRVAKSKFGSMPMFGKMPRGLIALQGDHGEIAFRNIKLRKIEKP